MDRIYAVQRHIYDATRKFYLFGRDTLIERLYPPTGGSVLEIGCGTARNLIAAARRWPEARFYGLDISAAMLEKAAAQIARARLSDRITLVEGDASDFDAGILFGVGAFDRVLQSYTLSMIPDWTAAIRAGADALAPNGRLSIVDFGEQQRLPRWWRRALYEWLARWHVTPRADLPSVIEAIAAERGWDCAIAAPMRGYAVSATMIRPASAR